MNNEVFSIAPVQFDWSAPLAQLAVRNNILVAALHGNQLLRIDLDRPHVIEDIEVPCKKNDSVKRIFLSGNAEHVLITTNANYVFYCHAEWKKAKHVYKNKKVHIDSVAWKKALNDDQQRRRSTGEFLFVDSTHGHIYESMIEASEDYFKKDDKFTKIVFSLEENSGTLKDLYLEMINETTALILVATTGVLYQYYGRCEYNRKNLSFQSLFQAENALKGYQELSASHISDLHVYLDQDTLARSFTWCTDTGTYYGAIECGDSSISCIDKAIFLPYPDGAQLHSPHIKSFGFAMSAYHFLFLCEERLVAACRLNGEIVWEADISPIVFDDVVNTYWIFNQHKVFEIIVSDEKTFVWRALLDQKQFQAALEFCPTQREKDQVLAAQAEFYIEKKRYVLAANSYAQSDISIEPIAFKFMSYFKKGVELRSVDVKDTTSFQELYSPQIALRNYLCSKLRTLKKFKKLSKMLIFAWIVQLFATELHYFREVDAPDAEKDLQLEFYRWLQDNYQEEFKVLIDSLYKVLDNYDRKEEIVYLADMADCNEKKMAQLLKLGRINDVLDVLDRKGTIADFYKYSSTLIDLIPDEFLKLLLKKKNVSPRHLLPTLMRYRRTNNQNDQVIIYLETCIFDYGNTDMAVHNFLLAKYLELPNPSRKIVSFISRKEKYFDYQYALRIFTQKGLLDCCRLVYLFLNLYEESVDLALKQELPDIAIEIAESVQNNIDLTKKMWLKIAKYYIFSKGDIKSALGLLKRTDYLKIEDLLPFFPDVVLIDDFKDEICDALNKYKDQMQIIQTEMDETTKTATQIALDLRRIRSSFIEVPSNAKCCLCNRLLLAWDFYAFPCRHFYHTDCLNANVMEYFLTSKQRQKVIQLQEAIVSVQSLLKNSTDLSLVKRAIEDYKQFYRHSAIIPDEAVDEKNAQQYLKAILHACQESVDGMLGKECWKCGISSAELVDRPYFDENLVDEWIL